MTALASPVVNVTRLIDDGAVTAFQVHAIVLCSLVAFLDGFDSQAIAIAAPAMAETLGVQRASLGPIFSVGVLGATVGALTFGSLSDRFGRKRLLVASTIVFGFFTALTAACDSYGAVLAIRFLAGIGLGGAVPCYLALSSEYAPRRRRAMVTSLIWAAFPLGATLGAVTNALILERVGWQSLFLIDGVLPVVAALVLMLWLPESVRFLIATAAEPDRVRRLVARLRPDAQSAARFVTDEAGSGGAPLRQLFAGGRAVGTLLLWVPFFSGFGILGIIVLWAPILLRDHGISLSQAAVVLGLGGIGPLIGMAGAGALIERFGARAVLFPNFLLGAVAVGFLGAAASMPAITATLFLVGLFVGIGASGAIALAALTYPTTMRSSGIGCAMGVGRFAQVLAPLFATLTVSAGWDDAQLFQAFAVAPLVAAIAVLVMDKRSAFAVAVP